MTTVNTYITVRGTAADALMVCRCGHELGPLADGYKRHAAARRYPVAQLGPLVDPHGIGGDRFEAREYACPACLVLYEVEVALRDDPELRDVELAPERQDGGTRG